MATTAGTYHISVGDLGQQLGQRITRERVPFFILLKPADGGPHTSSGDHRWWVHGKLEVCKERRGYELSPEAKWDPEPARLQKAWDRGPSIPGSTAALSLDSFLRNLFCQPWTFSGLKKRHRGKRGKVVI